MIKVTVNKKHDIYGQEIHLYFGYNSKEAIKFLNDNLKNKLTKEQIEDIKNTKCWCASGSNFITVIFIERRNDNILDHIGEIVHEVSHFVFDVLYTVSIKIGPDDQEPFCYYADHLTQYFVNELSRRIRPSNQKREQKAKTSAKNTQFQN